MPAEQHDATTEFNEALKAALNEGKYDELAGFFTADCVLLPPRGRMLEGRGPVSSFWRSVKTRFDGLVFTTTSLKDLGEATKRETGTYAPAAADGTARTPEGKYVFVWQLIDGEWQIESCIWNRSTTPGQGQGEGRQGRGGVQGGGQRQGGGQAGGQRRPGAGGQGAGAQGGGYGQGGGYRQGGQGMGGPGQGGYRQGNRPSFQGGGGIGGGGGRRGGGGQRRGGPQGGGPGGGQGGGGNIYEQSGGLYSDIKD